MLDTTKVGLLAGLACIVSARIDIINPKQNHSDYSIDEIQQITYAVPPDDGALGKLVVANPISACTPVHPIPYVSNDTFSWFLLVERYNCTFADKLANAQAAGYNGVIIYNRENPNEEGVLSNFFTSQPTFEDIRIYSVMVTHSDGQLLSVCTYDRGFYIDWYPAAGFSVIDYLIPCIIIILFCILMVACLVVVQHATRWWRERKRNAKYRLAKKYLKQLPVKKWEKGEEFEKYEVCSICLDEYQEGDKLRMLPCDHGYHVKCIDPWLTKNRRVCPLCKRKIVLPGMPDDSSDDETAPLLGGNQDTNGGTFTQSEDQHPNSIQVQVEVEPQLSSSAPAIAPGGHFSVNDEVEVLPRRKSKRKKRSRRPREVLDDITVDTPSTSSALTQENQMVCVTEMLVTDDEQPLV